MIISFRKVAFIFSLLFILYGSLMSMSKGEGWLDNRLFEDHSSDKWSFYLPDPVTFRPEITTPTEMLGFRPGDQHARHDQIVAYMYRLAEESERITIEEYGRTWQKRPLLILTISDPVNLSIIDSLRHNHLSLMDPSVSGERNIEEMPVVTWLGYSVHGNESSGANAAILTAYYLAAGVGDEIERLLRESIIILDPTYNPDGLDRFASWVNNNRSFTPSADPNHREHREPWPGSRSNHYWFDLNRDWMPVQHPESRARIRTFQSWKPNVLTDHHEMGTQATYFFQPGVPSRDNPLTPARTFELTGKLAEFHSRYLNRVHQLYWTEEVFDDFYLGKGSTYPDLQGTIGILFEQASSRGHLQQSRHGDVAFPEGIRNQFLTSLSTLYGSLDLRIELLDHMRTFYTSALQEAGDYPVKAWVFGDPYDRSRNYHLLDLLSHHCLDIYELSETVEADGYRFEPGRAWIVPSEQLQHRFVRGLFETRTEFTDSVFYDVSTWTLPLAFNISSAELDGSQFNSRLLGSRISDPAFPEGKLYDFDDDEKAGLESLDGIYAYLFEWHEYYAPRALFRLMDSGLRIKVSSRRFSSETSTGLREFDYGTILVSPGIQDNGKTAGKIRTLMETIVKEDGVDVYAVRTGLTPSGVDLGSPTFESLEKPSVMVISGQGVNSTEAGEIWHLLDQRYKIPVTMADIRYLDDVDLNRYNTILMVHGNYSGLSKTFHQDLQRWIEEGNTLVAQKNAVQWLVGTEWLNFETKSPDNPILLGESSHRYEDLQFLRGSQAIGGVILQAKLDRSHPLAYGFKRDYLPVFRNSTLFFEEPDNRFAVPVRYTDSPLLSGFVSRANMDYLPERPVIIAGRLGSGRIIMNIDNPNLRAFWFGTNKLFVNSIFFGQTIQRDATID